jgi:signal transduction histidine kinase
MQTATVQEHVPTVGELITSNENMIPQTQVHHVAERFLNMPGLDAVALVEGTEPVGLVTRTKLLFTLSRRFGLELYRRYPIIAIANTAPLIVAENEPITSAVDKALARSTQDVYDEIIVTDCECRYRGLLPIKQLVSHQSGVLAHSSLQKEAATRRAQDLERMNRLKSQFVAHVTHELRSPVNAMIGFAELVKIANERGNSEQIKKRLSLMISCATTLRALITNILDLSKIEAGKMEVAYEPFDVAALISEMADTARVLIGNKLIDVAIAAPTSPFIITSDPIKVRQIVMNLVSNAAKFTEQGKILLAFTANANRFEISVSDTGIGIRRENLDRLFAAFSRIEDGKTAMQEGTGLGLTISKNLIEMLGGTIRATSTFGKGSIFTVSLPYESRQRQGDLYGAG